MSESLNRHSPNKKYLQIVIKQEKEFFGFEEVIERRDFRFVSCECISAEGELYAITAREFRKRITNPHSLLFFTNRLKMLRTWMDNRIKDLEEIELFKAKKQYTVKPVSRLLSMGPMNMLKTEKPREKFVLMTPKPTGRLQQLRSPRRDRSLITVHTDQKFIFKSRGMLIGYRPKHLNSVNQSSSRNLIKK